ncbi:MAG TPA: zinc ribbon domain-containing protein [Blastocatellia bacterium]|nr:zinc ribbon domain-containing protein [Blastocatellia bacterium]
MYCPGCSTQANEGAKFCKVCGMNLSAITQALNGITVVSDPIRDREFKHARKQISDGIQGSAVGAAILLAAALPYFLVSQLASWLLVWSLALALLGIVKLFRSVGGIIDAKVGPKLLDPALQPRATGGLNGSQLAVSGLIRPSQRLTDLPAKPVAGQRPQTKPLSLPTDAEASSAPPNAVESPARQGTGRINRELSSPLSRLDLGDDMVSKLRN